MTVGLVKVGALFGTLFFVLLAATNVHAQGYPAKPIKLIVSFPPGSPPDIVGRVVAEKLGEGLGQQVLVENRPGAGGTIGTAAAAAAAPDGYTLHLGTTGSLAVGPALFPKVNLDPVKAFDAITQISAAPAVLVIGASVPTTDVKAFVEYTRSRPGRLNYGSVGNGSVPHILMEMFKSLTGADLVHVPYRNIPEAYNAMAAGDIAAIIDQPVTATPQERSGAVRILAIATAARHPNHLSVPTMIESGVVGFEASLWFGLVAPKGTPLEIIAKINRETHKILEAQELRERLARMGTDPAPSSPVAFGAFIAQQVQSWGKAVKSSGAKVD